MIRLDEVEPSDREAFDPARSEPGYVTEFTDSRRTGTGHSLDVPKCGDRCIEEAAPDSVTTR